MKIKRRNMDGTRRGLLYGNSMSDTLWDDCDLFGNASDLITFFLSSLCRVRMSHPRSLSELTEAAAVTIDPSLPLHLFYRSADLTIKQARVYEAERDLGRAYVLYLKYTNLCIGELPKHPDYKRPRYKTVKRTVKENCNAALNSLESIKPVLIGAYKEYQEQRLLEEQTHPLSHYDQTRVEVKDKKKEPKEVKEWNMQDALKGVKGVGYEDSGKEEKSIEGEYYPEYPSLGTHHHHLNSRYDYIAQQHKDSLESTQSSEIPPSLPPKPLFHSIAQTPPALPPKLPIINGKKIESPPPTLPPKPQLSQEAHSFSKAKTERGEPLRTINVPSTLQEQFLLIAQANTNKNIETCGILAGHLKNNILTVNTLIIPKQTGTSDTCTTENEEELFEFQNQHDLLTFGWIHTHPTQSCFLSSIDLHTHCSYQLMLPEAIAIVCAPRQTPNYGIFRLTDPPGLNVISTCRVEQSFHTHADLPIYTDATDTGHVVMVKSDVDVVDLR
ncbi:hypothetical protein BDF14DRAFT_1828917 [Spinellus fusiger]|nr:hypothetical protein BDF14DRAFT_1828917 [Spinellus fusiger]